MNSLEDINRLQLNRVIRIWNIECFAGYWHVEEETWSEKKEKIANGRLQVEISSDAFKKVTRCMCFICGR